MSYNAYYDKSWQIRKQHVPRKVVNDIYSFIARYVGTPDHLPVNGVCVVIRLRAHSIGNCLHTEGLAKMLTSV